jgi:UDP-N-acetylmuramoyl-tripeptide--D-alanyl-D-alanine ligase
VINLDDAYADYFFEKTQGKNCIAYSVQKMNSDQYPVVFASNISYSDQGMPSFDLCYADEQARLELQVPGLHNVSNALAASACAIASGLRLCDVVDGLQLYKSEKGRMCEKRSLNGVRVLDDTYNANPGSVRAAIDVLSACTGKKVLVLGDMGELGEFSKDSHRQIGCYAKQKNIDSVYTCGPLSSIAADTFGMGAFSFNDKQVLVTELKRVIDTNTTVLVKGSRTAKMEDIVKELCSPGEALSC